MFFSQFHTLYLSHLLLINGLLCLEKGIFDMTVFQIRGSKTFQEIDYAYPFTDRIYISKSDFEKMTSEITANFITATNIDPNDPILTSEPNALTELIKTIFQLSTSSAPELMNQEKRAFVFLSRNTDSAERLNALYNQSSKCDKDVIRSIINGYPPNPDLGCASGEMRCGGKLCMPIDWRCDGIRDCPDGSDERNCHFGCNNLNVWVPHYPCDFDRCFPWTERCDGKASCYDQSDERGCPPGCNKYEFRCDGLKCIPKSFLCDGVAQCEDETDEKHENCPCKNQGRPYFLVGTSTHPVPYLCDRGYPKIEESGRIRDLKERRYEKDNALSAIALLMLPSSISFFNPKDTSERPCLPKELLCESDSSWTDTAKHDCLDGADENPEHCQIYRKDQRCDGTEWACAVKPSQDDVRGCIPRRQWCDGRKNCHDASDENPAICRARDTDKCANMYKCRREVDYYATENNGNPQCIPNEWVCDGKQDCPGFKGWDEDSCSSHYQKFQRTGGRFPPVWSLWLPVGKRHVAPRVCPMLSGRGGTGGAEVHLYQSSVSRHAWRRTHP
ncbi:low-density lipoprotein receptor-related protein 1B-like isoform X3 [Paramacrobiotus metropolitanus]|uniref:low-density lipoprotein receptor-related protein 1B-like isoform X3 n=1 Tax=Paramacrobiotus metropolitanus TaxID=2943436 RepID=UPI002445BD12|nr:low-density lipoprotein receptor-related protein 1B-like isoform X3 [Paramacrobiotus metropolitanus]